MTLPVALVVPFTVTVRLERLKVAAVIFGAGLAVVGAGAGLGWTFGVAEADAAGTVGDAAGEAVALGEAVAPGDAVALGEAVAVGDAVTVGEAVAVGDAVGVGVASCTITVPVISGCAPQTNVYVPAFANVQ